MAERMPLGFVGTGTSGTIEHVWLSIAGTAGSKRPCRALYKIRINAHGFVQQAFIGFL